MLKQNPRLVCKYNIDDQFQANGSKRTPKDPNLYIEMKCENGIVNVVLDVENLIIIVNDT